MAKFYGPIGYGIPTEITPGVWDEVIEEVEYFGDVDKLARSERIDANVNPVLSMSNVISIIADDRALQNLHAIRYVGWLGQRWTVTSVEYTLPRLVLRLGGVYNGPTP